jgi:hypothetical protein
VKYHKTIIRLLLFDASIHYHCSVKAQIGEALQCKEIGTVKYGDGYSSKNSPQ